MTSSTSPTTSSSPSSLPPPNPQRTSEARTAFTTHLTGISNSHLKPLSNLSPDIRPNSTSISKQEADLQKNTTKLAQERQKQEKALDDAAKGLKELGDVQNWTEVLERDLRVIEETLERGEVGSGWVTEEEDGGANESERREEQSTAALAEHKGKKSGPPG